MTSLKKFLLGGATLAILAILGCMNQQPRHGPYKFDTSEAEQKEALAWVTRLEGSPAVKLIQTDCYTCPGTETTAVVTNATEIKLLAGIVREMIERSDGDLLLSYNPRHHIEFESPEGRVLIGICFEGMRGTVFCNGQMRWFTILPSPEVKKDFDAMYSRYVKKTPNQALVPTVMSVTPAADAPVAPATTAAHL